MATSMQVDFEKEAQHIAHFQEYLERTNMGQYATCPYVYKPFSSKRLLAMDRIRGVPLTDLQVRCTELSCFLAFLPRGRHAVLSIGLAC
jgi:predicted unusual protein kinase regulating ubiquinone biosynthesis (AarF/ABC1/UbiB family)